VLNSCIGIKSGRIKTTGTSRATCVMLCFHLTVYPGFGPTFWRRTAPRALENWTHGSSCLLPPTVAIRRQQFSFNGLSSFLTATFLCLQPHPSLSWCQKVWG